MSTIKIVNVGNDSTRNQVETVYDKDIYGKARIYSNVLSRYSDILRTIDSEENKCPHLNLYKFSIPQSLEDKILIAQSDTRLDILADEYYGDATLWWVIAMASNITDPFNVITGQLIRVPPITSLYDDYSILSRR